MDDWQYSISRPDDTNGHTSYGAGRVLLDWKPTSSARFELSFNGNKDKSQPEAQQLILLNPQGKGASAALISRLLASPFSPNNARAANWVDQSLDPATGVVLPTARSCRARKAAPISASSATARSGRSRCAPTLMSRRTSR
jgi:hypothetical protein